MDWTSKRTMACCLRVHPIYPVILTSAVPMDFKKSKIIQGCHQVSVCGRAEDRLLGPVGPQWILPNIRGSSSTIWQPRVTPALLVLLFFFFFFTQALWHSPRSQDGSMTAIEVGVRRRRRRKQVVGWAAFLLLCLSPHEEKLRPVHNYFEPARASRPSLANLLCLRGTHSSTLRLVCFEC